MRVAIAVLTVAGIAHADPGDAELEAGKRLATERRFTEAIVQFKAARRAAPTRPEPDCLIALAYRRLERWAQARLFLERCTAEPQHPDYYPQLVTDISDGLAHAGLTEVRFALKPADARISIASFAPGETTGVHTIYLEPGRELVEVEAPGFPAQRRAIDVPATGPYGVTIDLTLTAPAMLAPPPRTGRYVVMASGGVIAVGIVAHVLAVSTRGDLTSDGQTYDREVGAFKTERGIAIGAYAVGAVGLAAGAWLWRRERAPSIAPVLDAHGGGMAWCTSW
jgi:hypothetical protein